MKYSGFVQCMIWYNAGFTFAGSMLKEILEHMAQRRNGTDNHKLYLYAAHDLTQVTVMRAMGIMDEDLRPEYGAALIFELHTVDGGQDHEVKVKTRSSNGRKPIYWI